MSGGKERWDEPPSPGVVERIHQEEFARGHIAPGDPPTVPRIAATVVLARPARRGFDVLLLRRPATSSFAAGAFVFPGGVVDAEDEAPAVGDRLSIQRAELRAPLVAGIRELFEETGILLADAVPTAEVLEHARQRLLRGESDFERFVLDHDLSFREARIAYMARWITPARLVRRYDARFFLAVHPGGNPQLGSEHESFTWLTPAGAIDRFESGRLPMLFPTRMTLERLAAYRSLRAAFAAYRAAEVQTVVPKLWVHEGGVTPVLPGDPRYDDLD